MAENKGIEVPGEESVESKEATDVQAPNTEHQFTHTEMVASSQGWVPKDQWQGDPEEWVSAKEFVRAGELFSKIDDLNRKNKALEGTVHEVKRHYQKMAKAEYQRAINDLKAEKKEALDNGDSARVIQLDDAIANTTQEANQELTRLAQPAPLSAAQDPVFMVWENRNPWYTQDKAMKIFADTVGEELVYRGMTHPAQLLAEVERRVKTEFQHKFNNPNRNRPGAVEGGGSRGTGSKDSFQLTAEETQVMNKFIKHKVMTKDEYIKEIKAQRGAA